MATSRKRKTPKPAQNRRATPPRRKRRRLPSRRSWGILLIAMALAGFLVLMPALPSPGTLFDEALRGLLEAFGVGVVLVLLWLGGAGLALVLGARARRRWMPRAIVAALVATVVLFGLLAFIRPEGAGALARYTAGGRLGLTIVGAPDFWGVLRLLLIAGLGVGLLAPRWSAARAMSGARASWRAGRAMGRLREVPLPRPRLPGRAVTAAGEKPQETKGPAGPAKDEPTPAGGPVPKVKETAKAAEGSATSEAGQAAVKRPPDFRLPPKELLDRPVEIEATKVDDVQRAKLIEDKLAEYGVDAKVVEIKSGPTITQFGVEPGWDVKTRDVKERDEEGRIIYDKAGNPKVRVEEVSRTRVKVNRITRLANDLALALAAPTIRIEAPIPGRPMVGIEVPNTATTLVTLRAVIESGAFQKLKERSRLALALGQRADQFVVADLGKMPHLLIAGSTGSGKSVCINSIVACLLMHTTPQEVRLLMVDPKRVELSAFDGVPHLLAPVVVDVEKVVGVLQWVAHEMDGRYEKFAAAGARNLDGYNKKVSPAEQLPYFVVVIDELADLMMVAPVDAERLICRLAQLARATGIHLVIATQRPSVDVITGLIKANFPTRIAFAVTSQVDSRTILDMGGAEKLLGRGDMLFMPTDAAKPLRLQGTFVSDAEIERLVEHWKRVGPASYVLDIQQVADLESAVEAEVERRYADAAAFAVQYKRISESSLRRGLGLGKDLASRLIRRLEEDQILGPADGSGSHVVIATGAEDADDEWDKWQAGDGDWSDDDSAAERPRSSRRGRRGAG